MLLLDALGDSTDPATTAQAVRLRLAFQLYRATSAIAFPDEELGDRDELDEYAGYQLVSDGDHAGALH